LTIARRPTRRPYKPFGEQRGAANALPSERGFIGQVEDTATGLSYLNARHYDATNGTFLRVDPVLDLQRPESFNPFSYGSNSPVVLSDPSGLCDVCFDPRVTEAAKNAQKATDATTSVTTFTDEQLEKLKQYRAFGIDKGSIGLWLALFQPGDTWGWNALNPENWDIGEAMYVAYLEIFARIDKDSNHEHIRDWTINPV
jgi:RHS repeat-associated protein